MSEDNPHKKGSQRKGQSEQRRKSYARRLAMQAIYSWLINDDRWQDIRDEFHEREEFDRADGDYFDEILYHVGEHREELMAELAEHFDRPVEQLDPVEQAILMTGVYELSERIEVPYRVVLNEAVELAKRFGAAEGHRYVNALLDKVAGKHRSLEVQARKRS
ncbi:MAG: transcription antitermination factor NusB [Gammaproteobacteria bacterium]|nr:transcription antitermination factor NusB [Gammaproteobacteria bacterium]